MSQEKYTHKERMEICLSGVKPDRTPTALWRHFPVDDQNSDSLANAVINFQKIYQFDFVKVTPASSYCISGWGVQDQWRGHHHGTREYTRRAISNPEDWKNLTILDPHSGQLGMMLECLKRITAEFSPQTPVVHTIFNPLSQAKNLVGPENLLVHIRKYPDALKAGLEIILESTLRFIHEAAKTGIDGIFYAIQHAQYGLLDENEFEEFGKSYDLRFLNQMPGFWLNIGHIHGKEIMFGKVTDYPLQILNWHDQETEPSLSEAQRLFKGIVCGGLKQEETMLFGSPDLVTQEAQKANEDTNGIRFILGTGCVLPNTAPHGNILAARNALHRIEP